LIAVATDSSADCASRVLKSSFIAVANDSRAPSTSSRKDSSSTFELAAGESSTSTAAS